MPQLYTDGDCVRWQWGRGEASGVICEASGVICNVHPGKATYQADGVETTRHGSVADPVLRIMTPCGRSLVKLSSEVEGARHDC